MTEVVVLILVVVAGLLWLRFAPDDRDRWHVDPADKEDARRAEVRLIGLEAPRFPAEATVVLDVIESIASGEPRTRLIEGSADEGMITFVAWSKTRFSGLCNRQGCG